MITYQYLPHTLTAIFVLLATALFIYNIRSSVKKKRDQMRFDKQLKYSMNPGIEIKTKESEIDKALKSLPRLMIKAGLVEKGTKVNILQRKLILGAALIFTGTIALAGNILAGFIPVVVIYVGLQVYSTMKINSVKRLIEDQIPAFVSTFKAGIQADQHPQNAMINAIDNTAKPLYDELSYPKAIMEAGEFRPGIVALRKSTDNSTLRQLASCIELASASGSNIEKQIDIIEEIIEDKQFLARKKRLGINENKSLFVAASLFIPGAFVGSYFMSDMHRDFWFDSTFSWIVLVSVVVIMSISIFATWKIIQKVED